LNPFCFKDFLKESSEIYCNPDKTPFEIMRHSQNNINRNVKEFGIMTLALIDNVEDAEILQEPLKIN